MFLAVFAFPTALIMGSWNSLPGDAMYPVKLGLEQSLLFAAKPSYSTEASLNVKYTERRAHEAQVLLANSGSTKGLGYLSQQVVATRDVIQKAPNNTVRKQLASAYISQLQDVSAQLESQKQQLAGTAEQSNIPTQAVVPHINSGALPHVNPPTPVQQGIIVPTPTTTPVDPNTNNAINQIDNTQNEINNTINQLQNMATSDSVPDATPTQQQQYDHQNNGNDHQNNGNNFNNDSNQHNNNGNNDNGSNHGGNNGDH